MQQGVPVCNPSNVHTSNVHPSNVHTSNVHPSNVHPSPLVARSRPSLYQSRAHSTPPTNRAPAAWARANHAPAAW
eukprot:6102433-Pyramimonas_sp.AAC.1